MKKENKSHRAKVRHSIKLLRRKYRQQKKLLKALNKFPRESENNFVVRKMYKKRSKKL